MRRHVLIATAACAIALTALATTGAGAADGRAPSVMRMAGQLMFVRMPGRAPSADFLARIRRGEIGGVVLYATTTARPGRRCSSIDCKAPRRGRQPRLLIAIDQEGGAVQRLPGPPTVAPPR